MGDSQATVMAWLTARMRMRTRKRQAAHCSEEIVCANLTRPVSPPCRPNDQAHSAGGSPPQPRQGEQPQGCRTAPFSRRSDCGHVGETATTLGHFRRLVCQAELGDREHIGVELEPFLLAVQSEPPVVTAALFVAKQALHRGSFPYIAFSLGGAHFHASTVKNDCRKSIRWCL